MEAASALLDKLITYVVNPAILLVFAAGFAVFMYGLLEFMWNLNSGEASQEGKRHMVYGIIGMLIMISVYGILKLVDDTFGFGALTPGGGSATDVRRGEGIGPPTNFFGN